MKKLWTVLTAVLYVALGVAYAVDRAVFTSTATGFSQGAYWLRYLILAGALLFMLPAVLKIPARQPVRPAGGLARVLSALLTISFTAASAAEFMTYGIGSLVHAAHALLQLGTAAYMLWFTLQKKSRRRSRAPAHSAIWGILACASLYLLVPMRFMFHQSSLVRIGSTMQLLSALAALLFATACLRRIYLPESACGRPLCASGFAAFLLCTCQGVAALLAEGAGTPESLFTTLALAVLGLAGLYATVLCCFSSARQNQAQRQQ